MQVVAHMVDGYRADVSLNSVDSDPVPVPHFGLALSLDQFHALSARMKEAKVRVTVCFAIRETCCVLFRRQVVGVIWND